MSDCPHKEKYSTMSLMSAADCEYGAKVFRDFADQIEAGKVSWYAISVKYRTARLAIHSKDAPNRPKGLTP